MRVGIYVRVSTADQRDNGYSIDLQLRMLKEQCEKKGYDIVATYNDAGYSGKSLQRPNMQRAIDDIACGRIDILMAIKVDRLTRTNYDGFWLLKYCEENDVKIELTLEAFDLTTLTGEMMFGMNVMFGDHERKVIGSRTKRALEQMVLSKVHPGKAPFGYSRNSETGRLEINQLEANVVLEIFNMCRDRYSINKIASILDENNYYNSRGKWDANKISNILHNEIYLGINVFRKYSKKKQDRIIINDYCEPIIDMELWNITRNNINKNKHPNYGTHIHLFSGMIACSECGEILSSSNSMKNTGKPNAITYYHLVCNNPNCKRYGKYFNTEKIEKVLEPMLDELTRYMLSMDNEIIVSNNYRISEIDDLNSAIEKLKIQEKRLIDLYMSSTLSVDVINNKSEMIKSEIERLTKKKEELDPDNENRTYDVELYSKLNCSIENKEVLIDKKLLTFSYKSLNRAAKKDLIQRMIQTFDVTKDEKHNVSINNIKFSEEFVNKNSEDYINYVSSLLLESYGINYTEAILTEEELAEIKNKYDVYSFIDINNTYTKEMFNELLETIYNDFEANRVENKMVIIDGQVVDSLLLVPKKGI